MKEDLQRAQAALDAEREKVENLEHKIQSRGGLVLIDDARAKAGLYDQLETHLTQLKALVRALPVYEADALITVDGDLDEIDRPALRSAVMDLLEYRATLDATAPAECTNHFTDGSKIFPSRNCCSKGGDGE